LDERRIGTKNVAFDISSEENSDVKSIDKVDKVNKKENENP